ncbi:hypothetical protein WMC41_11875 [Shinella yambaruensis]|uniref:hypothetical protein n=1 Tax=Shinella yambaruensis TaxID=415996 RepID=UPI003D799A97
MSFRNRYDIAAPWIVVCVGFGLIIPTLFWLVSTEKYHAVYQQEAAKAQRSEAHQTFQQHCVDGLTRQELVACYKNAIDTAREPERSERNLKAQEDVASWAMGTLVVTFLSLMVTGVGVILVACTLKHTRRAADYAADMIDEAKETTRAAVGMNDLTRALETPLLGIRMPEGLVEFDSNGFKKRPVKFRIVNMGRSPAEIVDVARIWVGTDGSFPPPVTEENIASGKIKPLSRWVAPQSETEPIWADDRQLPAFEGVAPRLIFFLGFVRYRDAMKRRYIAGFCYFINPNGESEFAYAWPDKNVEGYNYCREEE